MDLPRPSVKWFKDDTELDLQNTNYFVHVDSLLEIRNVQFSDFGKYKCKASNEERTKFSRIAQLTQDSNVCKFTSVDSSWNSNLFLLCHNHHFSKVT